MSKYNWKETLLELGTLLRINFVARGAALVCREFWQPLYR